VWLVESDPDALVEVTARALGVRLGQGQAARDLVLGHLEERAVLLVLDNCEHLLSSVAGLVHDVVRGCPDVRVLATSREVLGLTGERIIGVPSLAVPTTDGAVDASTAAVTLLVERASLVRPDFRLDDANAAAIAHICRRLDGIPLALELAAARLRSMTPLEVADRLDHRFRLLTGGSASAAGRHQTLRAALDWSYDLLGRDERRVLQRCAVFAGGFDLDAAETVCAHDGLDPFDVSELLTRLVDKSLLVVETTSTRSRYRMLETIRDHTIERLEDQADTEVTRRRHAVHYAGFAGRAGVGLRGREERAWLERVELDLANLQLAVTWAVEHDEASLACEVVGPLAIEMLRIDHAVGGWAELVAAMTSASTLPAYADVAAFAGFAAIRRGDADAARAWRDAAHAGLAIIPEGATDAVLGRRLARVLDAEMIVTMTLDGFDAWARMGEERLAAARRGGDDWELGRALATLANIRAIRGDGGAALAHEAMDLASRTGNPTATCSAWFTLGQVVAATDPMLALQHLATAERAGWDAGNENLVAVVNALRGYLYVAAGTLTALPFLLQSLEEQVERGYSNYTITAVIELVAILVRHGRDEDAATLYGFWVAHRSGPPADMWTIAFDFDGLDARLRSPQLEPRLAEGAAFPTVDVALAFARRATEALLTEHAADG
jgi:predicted ATPase